MAEPSYFALQLKDSFERWYRARCVADPQAKAPASALLSDFRRFNPQSAKWMSVRSFGELMLLHHERHKMSRVYYIGVTLRDSVGDNGTI